MPSLDPDGVDIIKNWYDKTLGTKFEGTDPPELYHKYVGHDDNRDWYAFTQVETQLTVDKIHNVWHPQIVHDIHQQGAFGSRLFLPPYHKPVEPNVPKELVEGYTELGNFMANDLREKGFQGITTDSTYDAWTPARAFSHYHGGVRILSETASAKLATPITVKFEQLRGGLNYDAKRETPNFSPVWKGGEWHLRDITNYMTTAAFSLLKHASDNREKWLSTFYKIGKEAVRPRKNKELFGYILKKSNKDAIGFYNIIEVLKKGGVKVDFPSTLQIDGKKFDKVAIVKFDQPYGMFAKTLLEKQTYPNLKDEKGNPIPPYDVTAHTLTLLMGNTEVIPIYKALTYKPLPAEELTFDSINCHNTVGLYRSFIPSMDEGWTRWLFETFAAGNTCSTGTDSIGNKAIQGNQLKDYKQIIFPDQSPNQILNGYAKGTMPDEYTGGIGAEGVANLKKFVEAGGTLVFLNRASNFAIEQFNLPVRNVTKGLPRRDFFIPGSILRTELDTTNPITKGMDKQSIAWFEDSPAFEVLDNSRVKVIARYPEKTEDILLSGWALGAEKIAGKAALVEIPLGKGKIILFGFRPQYRGQTLATFPLLFNAIGN